MSDIKDSVIRNFLRAIAAIILVVYLADISINKIKNGKIYLDYNDGLVIIGCLGLLLAIEAVRSYVLSKISKKE
jgi:hypothetical protein